MPSNRQEFIALKNIISEIDLILSTTELPENRTARCRELLKSAIALTTDLIAQDKLPAAKALGRKGGAAIAKRGSEYFFSLPHQTHAGGRKPALQGA